MKYTKKHMSMLVHRLNQDKRELFESCDTFCTDAMKPNYGFIDNGANILAVAHCDVVRLEPRETFVGGSYVEDFRLDDRLGVHIILDLLPRMGINVDVLLTDDEERGQTTATDWLACAKPDKQYNWMVEFDRRGTDVVTYCYDVDRWHAMLKSVGYKIGRGTFSDISALSGLGCCGVNIGVSYYNEHSHECYADIKETMKNVNKFKAFYERFKDRLVAYKERPRSFSKGRVYSSKYGAKFTQLFDEIGKSSEPNTVNPCVYCGNTTVDSFFQNGRYCRYCLNDQPVISDDADVDEIGKSDKPVKPPIKPNTVNPCVYCGNTTVDSFCRYCLNDQPILTELESDEGKPCDGCDSPCSDCPVD